MTTPDTQPELYDAPAIYDILHTPGTAQDVAGLERVADLHGPTSPTGSRTWLEPACGTGRHLRLLAAHGQRVIGFDRSEASIAYAKARIERAGLAHLARFSVGSMTNCRVKPASVDLAFNTINTVRHLPTDEAVTAHLRLIADALVPGGIYAVGLSTTAYGLEPPSEDIWTAARGRCRVTQAVQYLPPLAGEPPRAGERTETVISHITVSRPSGERHITDRYALRTYSLDEWLDLIGRSAMELHAVTDEFGSELDAPECGYRLYLLRRMLRPR